MRKVTAMPKFTILARVDVTHRNIIDHFQGLDVAEVVSFILDLIDGDEDVKERLLSELTEGEAP